MAFFGAASKSPLCMLDIGQLYHAHSLKCTKCKVLDLPMLSVAVTTCQLQLTLSKYNSLLVLYCSCGFKLSGKRLYGTFAFWLKIASVSICLCATVYPLKFLFVKV